MIEDRLIEDRQPYDLEESKRRFEEEERRRAEAKRKFDETAERCAKAIQPAPRSDAISDHAEDLLRKALATVTGPRRKDYGTPAENYRTIADLVNPYLQRRGLLAEGKALDPSDLTIIMALTKIARLAQSPTHFDSILDLAGYAACTAACAASNPKQVVAP